MKRHGHLFVGILDFDNLVLAARKAQRGKHYRDNVLDFNCSKSDVALVGLHIVIRTSHNDGVFFPEARKENLVNTTIEMYLQDPPSSCMSCHQGFNARGRDFVGMLGSFR